MKTGMNLLLWTTHVTQEHFPIISRLKAEGFDGVEIPLFEGDAAHYKRVRAEIAQAGKVRLCIEYLNRFECYFLTTAADAVALVHRVNHPNFRTMYDTFHAHIEEKSQGGAIHQVAPVLGHFHVSEND